MYTHNLSNNQFDVTQLFIPSLMSLISVPKTFKTSLPLFRYYLLHLLFPFVPSLRTLFQDLRPPYVSTTRNWNSVLSSELQTLEPFSIPTHSLVCLSSMYNVVDQFSLLILQELKGLLSPPSQQTTLSPLSIYNPPPDLFSPV